MFSRHIAMVLIIVASTIVNGCHVVRNSVTPMVSDIGPDVCTKHRYRLSCVYMHINKKTSECKTVGFRSASLIKCQPHVFSAAGMPVVCQVIGCKYESAWAWTMIFQVFSFGVLPGMSRLSQDLDFSVELGDGVYGKSRFELGNVEDSAYSILSPAALLCFNGNEVVDGCRSFCKRGEDYGYSLVDVGDIEKSVDDNVLFRQALAYGIAVKLKELEDSGRVDAMLRKQAEQRSAAPAHNIVQLDRDSDAGFSYSFAIDLVQIPADMKAAARAVLHEFMKSVKEDYLDTFPNADAASLSVAFSNLKIEGRRIGGRAAVLTVKPLSLTYDATARRGKLSVRFNPGQADEARAWIRRNVKALARDKNIALITGRLPPEATFHTLGEKIDGNVMEIEFKTE